MDTETLVIFAHADPGIRHLYEGDYHLVFINKGAFSSSYEKYAKRLRGQGNMLEAVCQDAAGVHPMQYKRVFLVTFSAGYALAREILESPSAVRQLTGYVSIDSYHAPGNNSRLGGLVRFALKAKEGEKVCFIGHTDVPTYGYSSTTQVAKEVLRLVGGQGGHLVVESYDEKIDHKTEHGFALTGWGPDFMKRALDREIISEEEEVTRNLDLGPLALAVARRELMSGVKEVPGKEHNPRILQYMQAAVRNGKPLVLRADEYPWCAYFASWCMLQAAQGTTRLPHRPRAAVVELWRDAIEYGTGVGAAAVRAAPDRLISPGDLLILTRGGPAYGEGKDAFAKSAGKGHVGRVEKVQGRMVTTIDGNVNDTITRVTRSIDHPAVVGIISYNGGDVTATDYELEGFRLLMAERMVSAFESLPGKPIEEIISGVDSALW